MDRADTVSRAGWFRADWLRLGAAFLATGGLIWLITRDTLVAGVYLGAVLVLAAVVAALAGRRIRPATGELAPPDWSVTVAAIAGADEGIAITDRAGRMVCANPLYEDWFGEAAPPRLDLDDGAVQDLGLAMRAAWRDGRGAALNLRGPGAHPAADDHGRTRWQCRIERAGRGEDFLVWRFAASAGADPVADLLGRTMTAVAGELGAALGLCGVSAAVVDASGAIIAANAMFVESAFGDPSAEALGKEFAPRLQRDSIGRLCWTRDAGIGPALSWREIPLAPTEPVPPDTAQLMLIAEAQFGPGSTSANREAIPQLEAMLGQLPHGIAMTDRDGRLLFANAAFMRASGRAGKEPPAHPTDLIAREDRSALVEAIRRHGAGPVSRSDIAVRLAASPDDPVSMSLAGVRGLGDAAVLLGLTDSSEAARLKRQVEQATKMQAVGQLAGGVAHDFNNVLTAILGTCDLMLMRHMPGDSDYDDIQQIRASSNRAASLTRQLLAFSRQQTLRPEVLKLPDLVSETAQMLKRLIGEKIEFSVVHDRDLAPVRADPTQLQQVLVNLVVNARDAIRDHRSGRGRIQVDTRKIAVAGNLTHRGSEIVPAGEYTALIVEDDGGGIPAEILGKIFEPFFTTKEQGKGTGLGLSTVYGFVKQSGGFVFADTDPGQGTRFTVYLPAHRGAVTTAHAPIQPRREWSREARLLLVEDEEPVRLVAERALARAGYVITTARDGEEGLELLEDGSGFDLVISDVVMPIMDGPAMAREIRRIAPEMPVLFMSGYAEEQLRREIDIENVHFIAKPFSVQQISDKVGMVLGRA